MSEAADLTNQIIDFLYKKGVFAFRASSTGIFDQKRGFYRTAAKKGVSDIIAVVPPKGQMIAIEVKIGKDRLSLEQQGFIENILAVGGNAFVAGNFSDFEEWWSRQYP